MRDKSKWEKEKEKKKIHPGKQTAAHYIYFNPGSWSSEYFSCHWGTWEGQPVSGVNMAVSLTSGFKITCHSQSTLSDSSFQGDLWEKEVCYQNCHSLAGLYWDTSSLFIFSNTPYSLSTELSCTKLFLELIDNNVNHSQKTNSKIKKIKKNDWMQMFCCQQELWKNQPLEKVFKKMRI